MDRAARRGHVDVLEFLWQQGQECTTVRLPRFTPQQSNLRVLTRQRSKHVGKLSERIRQRETHAVRLCWYKFGCWSLACFFQEDGLESNREVPEFDWPTRII